MRKSQSIVKSLQTLALILVLSQKLAVCDEQSSLNRVHSDVDESSCLCGLNREILDKLELIVKTSQQNGCSVSSSSIPGSSSSSLLSQIISRPQNTNDDRNDANNQPQQLQAFDNPNSVSTLTSGWNQNYGDKREPESGSGGLVDKLTDEIKSMQSQIAHLLSNSNNNNEPTSQQQQPMQQPQQSTSSSAFSLPASVSPGSMSSSFQVSLPSSSLVSSNNQEGTSSSLTSLMDQNYNIQRPINSGFLGGLLTGSTSAANNEALNKLNQSQKVDTTDMQSALESTVPNVVSNIFSNIQNLTIETEQNKTSGGGGGAGGDSMSANSGMLTSIDGSSVSVGGSSAEQITAQGEQLFLQWIDHQLQSLHLTVSMAASIRRNSLNLFRRIVRQYVERVERMGGRVEDNVRRATQVALNNTQNLISFLLRNYLNFASGLMQIIGEQVSRVGKQLDSTGETIASVNLNPFDIVSSVIDSLPNPARYSEYFRAFGKYLMGESSAPLNSDQQQQEVPSESNNVNQDRRKGGLFSKTMGALGKTLGSWIG